MILDFISMEKNISGKKNNFDLLAADISKKERKDMLSRMSGKKNSSADDAEKKKKNASETRLIQRLVW